MSAKNKINKTKSDQAHEDGSVQLTTTQATFMLFSSAMGGGVLGLPKVLAFNGWAYGCVMIVLGGIVSAYAQLILMRTFVRCSREIDAEECSTDDDAHVDADAVEK